MEFQAGDLVRIVGINTEEDKDLYEKYKECIGEEFVIEKINTVSQYPIQPRRGTCSVLVQSAGWREDEVVLVTNDILDIASENELEELLR